MKRVLILSLAAFALCWGCTQKASDTQGGAGVPAVQKANKSLDASSLSSDQKKKILMQRSVESLNKADVKAAIQSINQAIQESPKDPEPVFFLAEIYMRLKNYTGAVDALSKVAEIDPGNGQAYYLMGVNYGLQGNMDKAAEAMQKSAAIFQQKGDEENLKRAVLALQQMVQAKTTPALPTQKGEAPTSMPGM